MLSGAIEKKPAPSDHKLHFKEVSFCLNSNRLYEGGDSIFLDYSLDKHNTKYLFLSGKTIFIFYCFFLVIDIAKKIFFLYYDNLALSRVKQIIAMKILSFYAIMFM